MASKKFGLGADIRYCSSKGCTSIQIRGIKGEYTFHCFPQNERLCKEWLVRCGREDLLCKTFSVHHGSYKICSKHFEDCQYSGMGRRLKCNAIPSIFPEGAYGSNSQDDEKQTSNPQKGSSSPRKRFSSSKKMSSSPKKRSSHLADRMSNREQNKDQSGVNLYVNGRKYFSGAKPCTGTLQDQGCSTAPGSPCEHYIELIEEKARNHKLRRANEALELQVEELVHRIQELQTSPPDPPPPSLAQGEFAGHYIDVKEEMDVEVKEEEELG